MAPRKETAGSGTPALELETQLLKSIIHHLGDTLSLFIFEFPTLKTIILKNLILGIFDSFIRKYSITNVKNAFYLVKTIESVVM